MRNKHSNSFDKFDRLFSKVFAGTAIVVALGAVTVFSLASSSCVTNAAGWHKEAAEKNAKQFLQELNMKYDGVSCVKHDSDGDGYVSCTVALPESQTLALECAGFRFVSAFSNEGCREQKINVRHNGP